MAMGGQVQEAVKRGERKPRRVDHSSVSEGRSGRSQPAKQARANRARVGKSARQD
jgi:hypothetical protein